MNEMRFLAEQTCPKGAAVDTVSRGKSFSTMLALPDMTRIQVKRHTRQFSSYTKELAAHLTDHPLGVLHLAPI